MNAEVDIRQLAIVREPAAATRLGHGGGMC